MKILFLTRRFYPEIGGVEKHVMEISKILSNQGHEVTVITEKPKGQKNYEVINNIKIHRISVNNSNGKNKKYIVWKWFFKNIKLIKNADIIHCHDVFFWYLPFRFLYPRKKVFTTFHGYESYPVKKRAIIIRKVSELLSNAIICVGVFMRKWYYANPTIVTYGAVDQSMFNNSMIPKTNTAVFIGRLDEQTGIRTYLEGVKLIKIKIPSFKFLVVGDGKYKKDALKVGKVLGFKKNPQTYLLSNKYAFVSRYLSILEALLAKRLVFAVYDNDIKKDYLEMSPFSKFIIIVGTPQELANKVSYFADNPKEEKEIIYRGYYFALKQTWPSLVDTYRNLWKS